MSKRERERERGEIGERDRKRCVLEHGQLIKSFISFISCPWLEKGKKEAKEEREGDIN